MAPRRIHTPRKGDVAPSLAASVSSTVGETLRHGISVLSESSGSARADALLLLEHVLGQAREWIVAHGEADVSEADFSLFIDLCKRRSLGEPIAYIIGSAWFCGREFIVDKSVLIPRPETEHLVEEAVAFIQARGGGRVLDVGTGSGAIACSIAAETGVFVDATDISPEAIVMAMENSRRLKIADRCRFFHGNLVEPIIDERYDVIVANLPYVPTAELAAAPDPTSFEPRIALDGGPDGLSLYRELMRDIPSLIAENGLVLLEAAPPTIAKLDELTRAALANFSVSICCDYAGLARYLIGASGAVNRAA
ncbi:MAG TPA: peptide chain release factor N(5)-glutamine methyltransferase [Candidatus Cybelea sp.]